MHALPQEGFESREDMAIQWLELRCHGGWDNAQPNVMEAGCCSSLLAAVYRVRIHEQDELTILGVLLPECADLGNDLFEDLFVDPSAFPHPEVRVACFQGGPTVQSFLGHCMGVPQNDLRQ